LIYASFVHLAIGLTFLLVFPILGTAIYFLSKKIKEAQQLIVRETSSLSGSTTETLRNVELVKSLGLEKQEVERLNAVNEKILELELKKVKMVRKLDFIQGTLTNALRSVILLLMLWLIFSKAITIGEFFTLWIYSFFVFAPLGMLGTLAASYQEARASLSQLEEVMALKSSPVPKEPRELGKIEKVEYKNVFLQYASGKKDALSGINLAIHAGETVAFVGPSGSGKSSMVKLLAGLYEPTKGKIAFNDLSMSEISIDALRQRIGLVAQETQLFAGTIRENLLFVRPDASDMDCKRVLVDAQANGILEKGSQNGSGLELRIGEGGVKLSGGERQRLSIARALLRSPDLIVFDEATSSLDSITEKAITDTIKKIESAHKELITILVSHRLSTVVHADRIYVFERGKIIETGTHDELVAKGGLYSALW
ncbi:MAG: ABC transporter ATP-binding protein, partial [Patescibacteria group bacterium]